MLTGISEHDRFIPLGLRNTLKSRFMRRQIFSLNAYQLKIHPEIDEKPVCM